jgi:hypothetical protein
MPENEQSGEATESGKTLKRLLFWLILLLLVVGPPVVILLFLGAM